MKTFASGVAAAALALAFATTPASAEDLVFQLSNTSSQDIIEFYTSPTDVEEWEADVLGPDNPLDSGEAANVTIKDGRTQCEYDFKFVMSGGAEVVKNDINLCELGSYTLTD